MVVIILYKVTSHLVDYVLFNLIKITKPLIMFLFWNGVHAEKGNAASDLWKSEKLPLKNRLCGLQMVQFECPRVTHPLVS